MDWRNFFEQDVPAHYICKPHATNYFRFVMHHGGRFVTVPSNQYIGGEVTETSRFDPDEVSSIEVKKELAKLGYKSGVKVWFRVPGKSIDDGLRPLECDSDVHALLEVVNGHDVIDLYIQHDIQTPEIISEVGLLLDNVVEDLEQDSSNEEDKGMGEGGEHEKDEGMGEGGEHEKDEGMGEGGEHEKDEGMAEGGEHEKDEGMAEGMAEGAKNYGDDDSLGGIDFNDPEYNEYWDWTSVLPKSTGTSAEHVQTEAETPKKPSNLPKGKEKITELDLDDDEAYDSDFLDTPPLSDDDSCIRRPRFPKFKMPNDGRKIKFQVGMQFSSMKLAKEAVKEYALAFQKDVKLKKNDKKRLVVQCKDGCPFYLRISQVVGGKCFQVKTYVDNHTCAKSLTNRQATTRILAKKFMEKVRKEPDVKTATIVTDAQERWSLKLSKWRAYRAKRMAADMVEGAADQQYANLWSYAEELKRSNPGSSVWIKVNRVAEKEYPVFERFYVCFKACKDSFSQYCRPLIGLDGCFLKGEHGGHLLSAIGSDGNNQMFPIAFAVVEAEEKETWEWFLEKLLADLGTGTEKNWSFISDQQKGLKNVINKLGPSVEHRNCCKHIYGNFVKGGKGLNDDDVKAQLFITARATTIVEWEKEMSELEKISKKCHSHMCKFRPQVWARSHFSTFSKCDLQVNNMCEAFNRAILEHRNKPIIQLIEGIRLYLMDRFIKQRERGQRAVGLLCPQIKSIVKKLEDDSDGWLSKWAGDPEGALHEVSKLPDKYVVNLKEKTCSCRGWDLTGIPCCHAIAAMLWNGHIVDDNVHVAYRRETFVKCYTNFIQPINGPKLWPRVDKEPIAPPLLRRAPGRPKVNRNKANDEPTNPNKLGRQCRTVKCRKCGNLGHNARSCKGKTRADREIPKGGNKKFKKKQSVGMGINFEDPNWKINGKKTMLAPTKQRPAKMQPKKPSCSQPLPSHGHKNSTEQRPESASQPDFMKLGGKRKFDLVE